MLAKATESGAASPEIEWKRKPGERMTAALMCHDPVRPDRRLPWRDRGILALLAMHDGTECRPGLDLLVRESGLDKRELRKVLAKLRGRGLISWRRTGKASVYTIHYSQFGGGVASAENSRIQSAGDSRTKQEEKGILRGLGRDGAGGKSAPPRPAPGQRGWPFPGEARARDRWLTELDGRLKERVGPVPQIEEERHAATLRQANRG